jgi:hypothetical protein
LASPALDALTVLANGVASTKFPFKLPP